MTTSERLRSLLRERVYRLGAIVPLVLGVYFLYESYGLSIGELTSPGPGLWPFIVSAVIILSSVLLFLAERSSEQYERLTSQARFIGFGVISLGVFVAVFELVGFIIPGFLTMAFWLRFLGGESWRSTLLIAGLCTAGFYVLFDPLLGVPLPDDVVAALWGG